MDEAYYAPMVRNKRTRHWCTVPFLVAGGSNAAAQNQSSRNNDNLMPNRNLGNRDLAAWKGPATYPDVVRHEQLNKTRKPHLKITNFGSES